jgi:hypothetical protein
MILMHALGAPFEDEALPYSWRAIMKKKKGDLPYRDEYHGEYEVLAEQRHHQTGGRNDLHHQQEEHVETNEDRD